MSFEPQLFGDDERRDADETFDRMPDEADWPADLLALAEQLEVDAARLTAAYPAPLELPSVRAVSGRWALATAAAVER